MKPFCMVYEWYFTRNQKADGVWRLRLGDKSSDEGMGYSESCNDNLLCSSQKIGEKI